MKAKARYTPLPQLEWLSKLHNFGPNLGELQPIWAQQARFNTKPALPPPHAHPYCECNLLVRGTVVQFVEGERVERRAGELFLAGPGVPHWATIAQSPFEYMVVYFQPWIFVDFGKDSVGSQILRRFTARQSLPERIAHPPPILRQRIAQLFREMVAESEREDFGWGLRLRSLLTETLILLLRWEQKTGRTMPLPTGTIDWCRVEKALQYLRVHFAESVYARDVAAVAGLSRSGLQKLFHEAMDMPWVNYLQGYRIHRAVALLQDARQRVTEVAFAVGFESLSHFNATFRHYMGMSPTEYAQRRHAPKEKNAGLLGKNGSEDALGGP